MKVFGERIKRLRNNEKMTQKQLAEKLNISESAVGMYERNEREPSFEIVLSLSEIFQVTSDFLLGKTNKPDGVAQKQQEINTAFYDFDNLTEEEKEHLELQLQIFRELKKREKVKKRNEEK